MSTLITDVRWAARMMWKDRRFTLVAMLALALGIGATSAIYTVVDSVLLRPLPFAEPDELVEIRSGLHGGFGASSYLDYVDFRTRTHSFSGVAAYGRSQVVLTGRNDPVHVDGLAVTPGLFAVLGVQPQLGRAFVDSDAVIGSSAVILSHALWQGRYRGDPEILGRAIGIDGRQAVVVGVMPPGFQFPLGDAAAPLLYLPFPCDANDEGVVKNRGMHAFNVVGRLGKSRTTAVAQADLDALVAQLHREHASDNEDGQLSVDVRPLRDAIIGEVRPALLLLLAAVACVLLIACANVAGLLLARATVRRREVAIRATLGATRARILRQLLTESLLLALAGGAAGLLLALWLVDLLVAMVAPNLPRVHDIAIDARVLGVTFAIAVVSSVAFGLMPALHGSRVDLQEALKDARRSSSHGSRRSRNALIVVEIAVALVLLFGAGLMLRSFARVRTVDPGFRPDGVVVAQIDLPARYSKDEEQARYYRALGEQLASLPADSVAVGAPLPFSHAGFRVGVHKAGLPPSPELAAAHAEAVSPGYFATMGIPLLRGRTFTSADDSPRAAPTVVVSDSLVRRLYPGEDPIGKRLSIGLHAFDDKGDMTDCEIVGIVGDVHPGSLARPQVASVYAPIGRFPIGMVGVVVRSRAPAAVPAALRDAILAVDRDLPPTLLASMTSLMDESMQSGRVLMLLLGLFAATALVLSTIGIYGVTSYTVSQRRRELGIRVAVGARADQILFLVLGESLRLAALGVALGLVASLALGRALRSALVGVGEHDATTIVAVSLLLLFVSVAASLVPAWRATRVDPMEALREE